MGVAREMVTTALPPHEAFDLWTDLNRWPSFVDGFGRVERPDANWPQQGSKITWRSIPGGRGTVTEKVAESDRGATFATEVFEEALTGRQTLRIEAGEGGEGSNVELELDYQLTKAGAFGRITDFFFIRRAQTDALRRTLRRFAVEAEDQASL